MIRPSQLAAQEIIKEVAGGLADGPVAEKIAQIIEENFAQVYIDLEYWSGDEEINVVTLCNECGQEIGTHPICSYCRAVKEREMKDKTPTEEIQYLGQMLTATTAEDIGRLGSIVLRLRDIYFDVSGCTEYTVHGQWR